MKNQDLLQLPEIRVLLGAIKREQYTKLLVGVSAIIIAVWILVRFEFERKSWIIGAISLSFLVIGIQLIHQSIRNWNPTKSKLIYLLLYQPQEIVWVYAIVTQRMPFGLAFSQMETMYFKLMDGDEITLRIPEVIIAKVSEKLNHILPHASFGYSEEREQWFRANPAMLLNENFNE